MGTPTLVLPGTKEGERREDLRYVCDSGYTPIYVPLSRVHCVRV